MVRSFQQTDRAWRIRISAPFAIVLALFAIPACSRAPVNDANENIATSFNISTAAVSLSSSELNSTSGASCVGNTAVGTNADDIIIGTTCADHLEGGDGDDFILGDPETRPVSETNVVYGVGVIGGGNSTKQLLLDIYQPDEPCTAYRPYVLLVHGGGFTNGSKTQPGLVDIANAVTARGYVAISINYRLDPEDPVPSSLYQPIADALVATSTSPFIMSRQDAIASAIEDAVKAIQWIEANDLERCIDTSRFAVTGGSAGAFIHMTLAYGLDEFFISLPTPQVVVDLWGGTLFDDTLAFNDPPLMIVHGTADPTVSYSDQALRIEQEAIAQSIPYTFYSIEGGRHSFNGSGIQTTFVDGLTVFDHAIDFIDAHLSRGTPVYQGRVSVERQ